MNVKVRKRWIMAVGVAIMILGLIHVLSAFVFYKNLDRLLLPSLFMFVSTGLAVILAGAVTVYCGKMVDRMAELATPLLRMVAAFFLLLAFGAIATMPTNPFAYIMVLLSLCLGIPVFAKAQE